MKRDLLDYLTRQDSGLALLVGSAGQPSFIRTSFYIDGFILYHSVKNIKDVYENKTIVSAFNNWQSLSWLDIRKISEHYVSKINSNQNILRYINYKNQNIKNIALQDIFFFTARPTHRPQDQQNRHNLYIDTLEQYCKISIIEGKFATHPQSKKIECKSCYEENIYDDSKPTEKQTDTNLAVKVISDVLLDRVDLVIIISNDSDIIPIIKAIKYASNKHIIVITPSSVEYKAKKNKLKNTLNRSADIKSVQLGLFAELGLWEISIDDILNNLLPNEISGLLDRKGRPVKNPYI